MSHIAEDPSEEQIAAAHEAIVREVGDHLQFNVMAYGKAWTGEGDDTEFIVGQSAAKALNAARAAGSAAGAGPVERMARLAALQRRAALWLAENAPGTPMPDWVDAAINDIEPVDMALMRSADPDVV